MVAGLVTSVIDAIANGPEGGKYASVTVAGVDPNDPSKIYSTGFGAGAAGAISRSISGVDHNFSERAFQWWPESIQDTIDVGWNFKDVGGASHALAQWSSNGGRTITFDVQLSRLMMPVDTRSIKEKFVAYLTQPDSRIPADNRPFNVDIKEQIRFLRGFCYPTYIEIEEVVSSLPPPVMILNVPNFGLNESGGDEIFCVMTGCDVTYTLAFRDGTPRRATVSLTLRQVVQNSKGVQFKGFGQGAPSPYAMTGGEGLGVSAGRNINGIDPTRVK